MEEPILFVFFHKKVFLWEKKAALLKLYEQTKVSKSSLRDFLLTLFYLLTKKFFKKQNVINLRGHSWHFRGDGSRPKFHVYFAIFNSDFKAFGSKSHVWVRAWFGFKCKFIYNFFHNSKCNCIKNISYNCARLIVSFSTNFPSSRCQFHQQFTSTFFECKLYRVQGTLRT